MYEDFKESNPFEPVTVRLNTKKRNIALNIPPDQFKELEAASNHLEAFLMNSKAEDFKWRPRSNIFDFMYYFEQSEENVEGKVYVMAQTLIEILTDFKSDRADDKSWRER